MRGSVRRQGGHGKGVSRAFRVIAGDQGRMDIDISPVLKIRMNRHGRHGTNAENGLEQAGAGTEIGDLPQEFHRMPLRLQGVILRAVSFQHNGGSLNLRRSGILVAGHHLAGDRHGAAHPKGLRFLKASQRIVIHHLRIAKTGPVKEINETDILLLPVVPDPALQRNFLPLQLLQPFLQFPGGHRIHPVNPPQILPGP